MGAIFGNFAAGAQVGAVLELLYIVRLPVGASIPPDDTGAAMFGGAAVITSYSIHYTKLYDIVRWPGGGG